MVTVTNERKPQENYVESIEIGQHFTVPEMPNVVYVKAVVDAVRSSYLYIQFTLEGQTVCIDIATGRLENIANSTKAILIDELEIKIK